MSFLQGNTYLKPIQVLDDSGKVVKADKVVKGEFVIGEIYKYYGEGGDVQWSMQEDAFIVPLTEEDTFSLKPDTTSEVQVRLLLDDGSVSGSLIEKHYVYRTKSTTRLTESGAGERTGEILQIRLLKELGTGGGTTDYNYLDNKPSINGVELVGNKTTQELGIVSKETDPTVPEHVKAITEQDVANWNDKVGKTDYATYQDFGISKISSTYNGLQYSSDKSMGVCPAYVNDINNRNSSRPVTPTNLDYAIKVGLTTNKETFTDEEKQSARSLIGAVGETDYATSTKAGVVIVRSDNGIGSGIGDYTGQIYIVPATKSQIDLKNNTRNPLTSHLLDYAVKSSLTANGEEWTAEDKANARNLIGASSEDYVDERFNGASKALTYESYAEMVASINAMTSTELKRGQDIFIVQTGIPDVWVAYVEETRVDYTYIDDDAFVNELLNNGTVQIGYYRLSYLETQKVDLADYVKKTDYATSTVAGVIVANANHGVRTEEGGSLRIYPAGETDINNRHFYRPITPNGLDYAVKVGVTTNKYTLTEDEKVKAQKWLGINELFGSDGESLLKVSPLTINGGTVDDVDGSLFEWLVDSDGNEYSIGLSVGTTYTLEFEIDGAVMEKNALAMDGSVFGLPGQVVIFIENISSNEYNDILIAIQDMQEENKTLITYGRSVPVPYEIPSITIRSIKGGGSKYYTKAETEAYVQEQIANSITSVLNTEV